MSIRSTDARSSTPRTRCTARHFDHVVAIRPAINARLQLLLDNGESVMVSRQYAPAIKRKLGL